MRITENYGGDGAAPFMMREVAEAYDARPGYPREAVHYLLEGVAAVPFDDNPLLRVLDAGCGNGLLTEDLLGEGLGAEIFALDQSEAMLIEFRRSIGQKVTPILGTFNRMPFGLNSFDLVAFGTSLHWGDPDQLPKELYRVVRPGGIVVCINNITREGTEFSSILAKLPGHVDGFNPLTANRERLELGVKFCPTGFRKFNNDLILSRQAFNRLLSSISLFSIAPDIAPERLARAVWQTMQDYADRNTANNHVVVPFDTYVCKAKTLKGMPVGELACRNVMI